MRDYFEIFSRVLPPETIILDKETIAPHLREWRDRYFGITPIMLCPQNTQQIQAILQIANRENIKITTQGGNTGLVGGQIPQGEVLLSLKKLNKIIEIRPDDDCIIVESGAILENVQNAAKGDGRYFPLTLASQGSATIGGLISTNAGGVHVRKFGMMRALVMGLEVVLPSGEIYCELSPLRKDNTGYDLKHFFIGAEGTLGVITKAALKLVPPPKSQSIAMVGLKNIENAITCLHKIEAINNELTAFEIMNENAVRFGLKNLEGVKNPLSSIYPYLALLEFSSLETSANEKIIQSLEQLYNADLIEDATISQSHKQFEEFWKLREGMSAAQKPEGRAAKHDISVPISRIPDFFKLAEIAASKVLANVRIVAFGHISDGNIHYDVARPVEITDELFQSFIPSINRDVHDVVIDLGGSISAEHGIGIARAQEFKAREPITHLNVMKAIKNAFDPNNILNPRIYSNSEKLM